MTVPATARRAGPYSGNGVTTSFSFSFKTFAAADLLVTRTNTLGVETTLVLDSDYSVTLNPDQDASPGGTITYPISGSPLASGFKLTIIGDLEYEQTTDLLGGGAFNARVIEDTFDRTVIQIQQLEELADRSIKAPVSDTSVDMTLPVAADRANRYLSFDVTGKPVSTTFDIDAVQTAASTAVSAAAAAAQSEANAANAETVALAQAAFVASTVAATTPTVVNFSGDGATVAFTLPSSPGAEENTLVFISGVYQQKTEYSVTGTTLTFTSAPPAGTNNIEVQIGPATNIAVNTSLGVSYLPAGTGAVATTVQAKLRETVSVRDFGAVGDGVTDDTAAIQAAIDAVATSKGVVLVPSGTYRITDEVVVKSNVILLGEGIQNTRLNWAIGEGAGTNKALLRFCTQSISTTADPATSVSYAGAKEMVIYAGGCDVGVYCRGLTDESELNNLWVLSAQVANIVILKSWYAKYDNLTAQEGQDYGIVIGKALFGETGDLYVNSVSAHNMRALKNGQGGTFNISTNPFGGAGIVVEQSINIGWDVVTTEQNEGPGFAWRSYGPQHIPNMYCESNTKAQSYHYGVMTYYYSNVTLKIGSVYLAAGESIYARSANAIAAFGQINRYDNFASFSGTATLYILEDVRGLLAIASSTTDWAQVYKTRRILANWSNVDIASYANFTALGFYNPYFGTTSGRVYINVTPRASNTWANALQIRLSNGTTTTNYVSYGTSFVANTAIPLATSGAVPAGNLYLQNGAVALGASTACDITVYINEVNGIAIPS